METNTHIVGHKTGKGILQDHVTDSTIHRIRVTKDHLQGHKLRGYPGLTPVTAMTGIQDQVPYM